MRGKLRSIIAVCGVLVVAVLASGCAGNESYPNKPKPPAILTISVFVGEDQIAASPQPFGAGPARFIITNQTGVAQKVLISTDQFDLETVVGVGQTANVRQTIEAGELTISTDKAAADPLTIDVSEERPSAQQDLNQP